MPHQYSKLLKFIKCTWQSCSIKIMNPKCMSMDTPHCIVSDAVYNRKSIADRRQLWRGEDTILEWEWEKRQGMTIETKHEQNFKMKCVVNIDSQQPRSDCQWWWNVEEMALDQLLGTKLLEYSVWQEHFSMSETWSHSAPVCPGSTY